MNRYVALLRGVGPANPNMRNDKLRSLVVSLGFDNVRTVVSSGNVVVESPSNNARQLENAIETIIPRELGFKSTTILRSKEQLDRLAENDPFKGMQHSRTSSLNVTFLKKAAPAGMTFRHASRSYQILGMYDGAVCSVIDATSGQTPELMLWLEKQFGKEITTRTWNTVVRIRKAMR